MNVTGLIAWSVVFLLFVYGFYHLLTYAGKKRSLDNAYEKLALLAEERKNQEELLMKNEGNREKVNFLTRLDILISQSGVKKKMPFLTAEIYIGLDAIFGIACLVIALKTTGIIIFSVVIGLLGIIGTYVLMQIMANNNAKNIEEDMNVFLDLLSTYSKSSDDIVDIMGKVYPSLHEPLSGYIEEFYFEAINVDAETAFMHLNYKLPHEKLKEVLGNLQICSNQLTDYSNIVMDSQNQLMVYLEGKRERADARQNGGKELASFSIIGVVVFYMLGSFSGTNVFQVLTGSVLGQFIILYFGVILSYGLILTFSFDKG